jgi:hypothetical protein
LRERLTELEIALGFYPNIPARTSKAYDEVRAAVDGLRGAAPDGPAIELARLKEVHERIRRVLDVAELHGSPEEGGGG